MDKDSKIEFPHSERIPQHEMNMRWNIIVWESEEQHGDKNPKYLMGREKENKSLYPNVLLYNFLKDNSHS